MALLCLPLAGAGGLCIWGREKQIFSKESLRHYLGLFAALVIGMGVFYGLDVLAYSDPNWKDFRQFFDERTILYDYHLDFIEQYDENREAYEETGVSRTLQEMLKNYNFGAADEIDTQMLSSLAVQAKKTDAKRSEKDYQFFQRYVRRNLYVNHYYLCHFSCDLFLRNPQFHETCFKRLLRNR